MSDDDSMSGTRTCFFCQRVTAARLARCMYCGSLLGGPPPTEPPAAAGSGRTVFVECPGCLRAARGRPEAKVRCTFCGLQFLAPDRDGGPARLGPLDGASTTSAAAADAMTSSLPAEPEWTLVGRVLRARARAGDLVVGEGEATLAALAAISRWRPEPTRWTLPVAPLEAEVLIPRAVLGCADVVVRRGPVTELDVVVAVGAREDFAAVLGFDALAAFFDRDDQMSPVTQCRFQAFVQFVPDGDGIEFRVWNRVDQNRPIPLAVGQIADVSTRLAASFNLLTGYYFARAIMGDSCRNTTAFSLTEAAIDRRLSALGCPVPASVCASLAIRMPPAVRWFER